MVVKFTPTVVKFTLIGVCSLVRMLAEFGTLGGRLISYSRLFHHWLVHYSLVGASAEFGTLGGMLVSYSR